MPYQYLDFESAVAEIDGKILQIKALAEEGDDVSLGSEIARLETKSRETLTELYRNLTPWQKAQVARHPDRPHCIDYVKGLVEDFTALSGDRAFAEDDAMIAGLGRIGTHSVAVIGQEKGADTQARLKHNFGMARPEGYRKAIRLMNLAERFQLPVVTFVDTAGAYPGIGAEERGQAEAIARAIETCLSLTVPVISVIIGEGGSGGAIAIATANRVFMLEHAIYSVISPEGAASILWRDAARAREAAQNMKITAQDLIELKIIDGIIKEPEGGAHRAKADMIKRTGERVRVALDELDGSERDLRQERREKFLAMGRSL